jgi:hypothetical protein
MMARPAVNMIGKRVGRLTVVSRAENSPSGKVRWNCLCDCGGKTTTAGTNLRCRDTASCGCFSIEMSIFRGTTHGASDTGEYVVWSGMKVRCLNPDNDQYFRYGGRGITICERWMKFENFYADMGPRPSSKHTIERVDNDGDYEPSNCIWATRTEQSNNRSNTVFVTYRGTRMAFMDAVRLSGNPSFHLRTVKRRLVRGMSMSQALGELGE